MKKIRAFAILIAALSVFVLTFLIGRVTALDESKQSKKITEDIYTGTIDIPAPQSDEPATPTAQTAKKVEKTPLPPPPQTDEITPPVRMKFPCGNIVQKPYSEAAVYSKTMDDWRAHEGVDYTAEEGCAVAAAWDGSVTKVYKDKLWGNVVEIYHGGGVSARYCNLAGKVAVKENQRVKCGDIIGAVGKSASVESKEEPHLHLELFQDGIRINPESYLY